jgi:hypothetical protein
VPPQKARFYPVSCAILSFRPDLFFTIPIILWFS